jgi:nitroimidazol reductase NimA-like FMN-containing flavoprotein (pyridoxamine 5'-phosphate oxidase superfamily)
MPDHADKARKLIRDSLYLALGTADAAGKPWVSPVYYTPHDYTDFYWVSSPQARHSRNLAQRSDVSIAIFDSHAVVGKAEAVYLTATAVQVPDEELESAVAIYNSRLPELKQFEPQELVVPGLFRLYRATATEHSVLIRGSDPEYGKGADSRLAITIR